VNKNVTVEAVIEAVKMSRSIGGVLTLIGLGDKQSCSYRKVRQIIIDNKINCDHFCGVKRREKHSYTHNEFAQKYLVKNGAKKSYNFKLWLYKLGFKDKICEKCKSINWLGKDLTLHLHHIDGDDKNNELCNLQILCPNCHSQTDNFGNKSRGKIEKGRTIYKRCTGCDAPIYHRSNKSGFCFNCYAFSIRKITASRCVNNKTNPYSGKYKCTECGAEIAKNNKTKLCLYCYNASGIKRKIKDRPSTKQLLSEVEETNYCMVGKKYGVSDNCIRKWIRSE